MNQSCKNCSTNFEITEDDMMFYDSVSPVFGGQKFTIPAPTHCPDCRQRRRLAKCNEFNLYSSECGLCHKKTLTQYPPQTPNPIYCRECWHSDKWDPCNDGKDFDFTRPFFEQFKQLCRAVPLLALSVQGTLINSEYVHYAGSCKNCYLIMHADFCEDCYYGYGFKKNKFCVDGFYNLHSELCYDGVDIHKSYGLIGCQDALNCSSSAFLRDCIGCKDCFLCVGLRQKQYCFENKQLTKEEYTKKMAEIDLGSHEQYQKYKARLREMEKAHTFKEYQGHNVQNGLGDHLINCKDAQFCFDCEDVEGAKFCSQVVLGGKNIYDIYQYGSNLQQSYECSISGEDSYHLLFCDNCHMGCADLTYCIYMEASKNCFGSTHMARKQYCILNKQYTKQEYEVLVPKIIEHMKKTGEWGEFFPIAMSPFGYNKTSAQMYYPLTEASATAKGFKWDSYESPVQAEKTIPAGRLPDHIKDIPDDVLNWAITCEITGKPFKITPQELKFYRQQNLPLPRRHPHQRHLDRLALRNPRHFWKRPCDKCRQEITTTFSPEKLERVYCENCYQKVIY